MRTVTSHLWHLCLEVEGGFGSTLCHMPLKLESREPFRAIIIVTLLCVSRGASYSSMNSFTFCTIAWARVCLITLFVLTRDCIWTHCCLHYGYLREWWSHHRDAAHDQEPHRQPNLAHLLRDCSFRPNESGENSRF